MFTSRTGFFFFFFFWVTGELSTLRQLMKVPNEPGLSPNNGLENVSLSDQSTASNPRKGQAKCPGAKTTSHDGRAGHVMGGGFELLSGFGSSDGRSDIEACGTHSPRGAR